MDVPLATVLQICVVLSQVMRRSIGHGSVKAYLVILVYSEQLQLQTTVIMKLVWMCYLSLEMEDVDISNERWVTGLTEHSQIAM